MFQQEQHLLYLDLAVENEVAPVKYDASLSTVALVSGSSRTSGDSGLKTQIFLDAFGRFDTRYTTPKTTSFISQPFGKKEFDLFHFETISDGAWGNDQFKVSIANLRASTDPGNPYGSFEVQVRKFGDSDKSAEILERYPECNLNPKSENFIAKKVGDYKVRYDFDQEDPDERRLVVTGKYPNLSQRIRVVIHSDLDAGEVPSDALPFGFRGLPVLKTSDTLTDSATGLTAASSGKVLGSTIAAANQREALTPASNRLTFVMSSQGGKRVGMVSSLTCSIVPPVPMTFKVTNGEIASTAAGFVGRPGDNERVDGSYYWGIKTTTVPRASAVTNPILQSNASRIVNPLVRSLTKFQGIKKLDTLITGSATDDFNSNKFSLAKVAFSADNSAGNGLVTVFTAFTGSVRDHMLDAAYIRNGNPDTQTYTVSDRVKASRFTMASLLATSSVIFNRFTPFAKFTNVFYGGFDGLNILDRDQAFFRDRALSSDIGGKAASDASNIGLALVSSKNQAGGGRLNNNVSSINRAVDIITDPTATRINILAIPGVREPYVTDHALDKTREYSQAIYVMDTLTYDENSNRLYDDSKTRVDVRETAEKFESRAVDNNYGATFFPDVFINDERNRQIVKVPASVAALGAMAYNDKVKKPWFAPAGFNRGSLDFVTNVETRLSSEDRDILYDARVNPIAVFPRTGFVIFGQKTLQAAKSALDRINVRRLMLEIKRVTVAVATRLLFEPNTPETRARFIGQVTPLLALIQAQAGIEQFKVVMDDSNNTQEDIDSNRLNGKIIVVPTRAVEFIAVDFIITNSGVEFA